MDNPYQKVLFYKTIEYTNEQISELFIEFLKENSAEKLFIKKYKNREYNCSIKDFFNSTDPGLWIISAFEWNRWDEGGFWKSMHLKWENYLDKISLDEKLTFIL